MHFLSRVPDTTVISSTLKRHSVHVPTYWEAYFVVEEEMKQPKSWAKTILFCKMNSLQVHIYLLYSHLSWNRPCRKSLSFTMSWTEPLLSLPKHNINENKKIKIMSYKSWMWRKQIINLFTVCLMGRFPSLPWEFLQYYTDDSAAHQCGIRILDLCPRGPRFKSIKQLHIPSRLMVFPALPVWPHSVWRGGLPGTLEIKQSKTIW